MNDFVKHIPPRLLARTMLAWDSIPRHLSLENKKFVFGQVRKGARAADFEEGLAWLQQAGLICKVRRVGKPHVPLSGYTETNAFKVFMLDVGLLGAMCPCMPSHAGRLGRKRENDGRGFPGAHAPARSASHVVRRNPRLC